MEYDGKTISVDARISINSDRGIVIVPKKEQTQKQEQIRRKIIGEIKDAFENPHNRKITKAFVKDLIDELKDIKIKKLQRLLNKLLTESWVTLG